VKEYIKFIATGRFILEILRLSDLCVKLNVTRNRNVAINLKTEKFFVFSLFIHYRRE